ncbi:hypothetical protein D3C71_447600 [compost metagenome]
MAVADAAGGKDVFTLANRAHFGAHQPRDRRPGDDADGEDQRRHRRLGDGDQRHQQDETWHGLEDFDQPLQAIIDTAAKIAGQRADAQAQQHAEQTGEHPHLQRHPAAMNDPRQHVTPQCVGAQWIVPILARPQQGIRLHRQRISGVEQWRKQRQQGDCQKEKQPAKRRRITHKASERSTARRAHRWLRIRGSSQVCSRSTRTLVMITNSDDTSKIPSSTL